MKAKNIRQVNALVKRYKTITIEEITIMINTPKLHICDAMNKLTGFGRYDTCKLCIAVRNNCDDCFYGEINSFGGSLCSREENKISYRAIRDAETPTQLLLAYRKRAKHIEKLLVQYKLLNKKK